MEEMPGEMPVAFPAAEMGATEELEEQEEVVQRKDVVVMTAPA